MKTARRLFPRLCDPEHLDRAATATVRGKRRRCDVASFLFQREDVLARLQADLAAGRYQPGRADLVSIRDPKPRLITRMPIADRIVHTALVHLMEPVFLPGLRPEAYACREGFGTHRAVLRLWEMLRRRRFVLHLDIKSYFPSIDLAILRGLLARRIHDERFLAVVDRVLTAGAGLYDTPTARAAARLSPDWPPPGRGLPIGSYTSQLFAAHVYPAELDHHIKRVLKVPGYLRYVDDLFLAADRRADLRQARGEVSSWLQAKRGLRLKHPEARVLSCRGHLNALGYRITRDGIQALPRAFDRLRRRIAAAAGPRRGKVQIDIDRSIASSAGIILF
jgi:retron-type reverse transcriptase